MSNPESDSNNVRPSNSNFESSSLSEELDRVFSQPNPEEYINTVYGRHATPISRMGEVAIRACFGAGVLVISAAVLDKFVESISSAIAHLPF